MPGTLPVNVAPTALERLSPGKVSPLKGDLARQSASQVPPAAAIIHAGQEIHEKAPLADVAGPVDYRRRSEKGWGAGDARWHIALICVAGPR